MRHKRSLSGLPFVAVALLVASACSDQAEGDRCSKDNGDTDCASGLICKQLSELGGGAAGAGVCCPPPNGSPATTEVCLGQKSQIPGDGGPAGSAGSSGSPDAQTPPIPDASPGPLPEASLTVDAQTAAHD